MPEEKIVLEDHKPFIESTDLLDHPPALRQRMRDNGYLFLRGVGPKNKLLQLRRDILELCREAGWLDPSADLMEAKWNGAGPFTEGDKEYMDVYKKIIHLESFAAASADERLTQVMANVLNGPVLLHNRKIG